MVNLWRAFEFLSQAISIPDQFFGGRGPFVTK